MELRTLLYICASIRYPIALIFPIHIPRTSFQPSNCSNIYVIAIVVNNQQRFAFHPY